MVERAHVLKTELSKLTARPDAEALSGQLDELLGEAAPIGGTSDPRTLTSISEWLDALAQAVDGADGAPTADNVRSFEVISAALNAIEPRWTNFESAARAHVPAH